jgi:hypothetical protein
VSFDQILVWLVGIFDAAFLVLLITLAVIFDALRMAQKGGKLDLARMFKDDAEKESGLRLALLGAFAFSSWALMYDTYSAKKVSAVILAIYLATWSGAPIFSKALDKWDGKLKGTP